MVSSDIIGNPDTAFTKSVEIEAINRYLDEPIAMQIFCLGVCPPILDRVVVELGGRVWYRVKYLRIRYNLFAGADTLLLGGTVPH